MSDQRIEIRRGDCMEILAQLAPESVTAIVTDPPYGLSPDGRARTWDDIDAGRHQRGGFMGKAWDSSVPGVSWARACYRVLKPGGWLVAFGGTRTIHRMICGIEDADFEIRDLIGWLTWQGFPKSMDVSKAIDAAAGVEREIVGTRPQTATGGCRSDRTMETNWGSGGRTGVYKQTGSTFDITAPSTPEAIKWDGWGSALKPSQEPACLARKPFLGTLAANVLEHGTGALNIDACRIKPGDPAWPGPAGVSGWSVSGSSESINRAMSGRNYDRNPKPDHPLGRWPANIYHCPKPSRSEREAGCGHLPTRAGFEAVDRAEGSAGLDNPRAGAGRTAAKVRNHHPTVKPIGLMRWICRLVGGIPGEGLIVDPFMGSGTTIAAAAIEGFSAIGIEREAEYLEIAEARIKHEIGGLFGGRVHRFDGGER